MRYARLLVLIGILIASFTGCRGTQVANVQVPRSGTPHTSDAGMQPIIISGDAGWSVCPWVNGSGTWGDPYILSNLTINGTSSAYCIQIVNSSAVFRIDNCNVSNAGPIGHGAGIELTNVSNGILSNNTCKNNANYGIYIGTSTNITIIGNNCTGNSWGIRFFRSNWTTTFNNNVSRNGYLIQLDSMCNNNTITGNFFKKNGGNYIWNAGVGNNITGNTYINLPWIQFYGYTSQLVVGSNGNFQCGGTGGIPPLIYWWNFGDGTGNFINYTNINHIFTQAGTFNVTFAVVDAEGDQDMHTLSVGVTAPQITVSINAPYASIFTGEWTSFSASPIGGTAPYSYQWNFGDGTTNSTSPNPTHRS